MKVGDLVRLYLNDSVGLLCKVEPYAEKGAYEGRMRYWVAWQDGKYEWSWENELDAVNEILNIIQPKK